MDEALTAAAIIFGATYLAIMLDIFHRTTAALIGAVVMYLTGLHYGFLTWEKAITAIDFEVICLLLGMMIIVAVLAKTGFFNWLGIKIIKSAKGDLWKILLLFVIITAVTSAFLDNVTTVLLMTPPLIEIASLLKINPVPFLISEVLASNIGGTATLIGDPPNVIIASRGQLTFNDFIWYQGKPALAPIIIIVLLASIPLFKHLLAKSGVKHKVDADAIEKISEEGKIADPVLFKKTALVLAITIGMFVMQKQLELGMGIIALFGATLLLAINRRMNVVEPLHSVEWPVLLFFAGLFVVIKGAEEVGLIEMLAKAIAGITGNNLLLATGIIIWTMAFMSAIVGNIPTTVAMIPMVQSLSAATGLPIAPLWWALALGACLGGNGTLIGAPANVIVAGICDKIGKPITFKEFAKVGLPFMIYTVAISHFLLWLIWVR